MKKGLIERLKDFIVIRQVELQKKDNDVWVEGKLDGFREFWDKLHELSNEKIFMQVL